MTGVFPIFLANFYVLESLCYLCIWCSSWTSAIFRHWWCKQQSRSIFSLAVYRKTTIVYDVLLYWLLIYVKYNRIRRGQNIFNYKPRCVLTSRLSSNNIHLCLPDNIWMDLKETGINTRNWVGSAQDRDFWRALVSNTLLKQR